MLAPCNAACNTRISLPFTYITNDDDENYVTLRIDGDDGGFVISLNKCCYIFRGFPHLVEQQNYNL